MVKKDNGKAWFIRQVTEGDSSFDAETIMKFSEQFDINFAARSYFCVAVQYMDNSILYEDISRLAELEAVCSGLDKTLKNNIYCYTGPQMRVVMIVSADQADRTQTANLIYTNVSKKISVPVQIGVGRSIEDVEKLSYSRVESYEALNYINKDITISYIEDIYATRSSTTRKLDREKRKIVELFRVGDWVKMKKVR